MKIKVGVMFGGKSVEHEISIISAIQAIGYLNKDKYDVIPIYITKNNEFYVGEDIGKIEAYADNVKALLNRSQRVLPVSDENKVKLIRYPFKKFGNNVVDYIDVAFPVVHGTNVEDGTLQGYLKMLNIPYVGCDVVSSAVGMDKYVMKTVLKDNGIPVLDCKCYTNKEYDADNDKVVAEIETAIGYPVIVKPVNLGSSIGISKADSREKLLDSLDTAFSYAGKVLVEKAVQNLKEINCSVLGDYESAKASECEEPIGNGDILDFKDKYIGDGSAKGAKGGVKGGSKGGTKSGSQGMATLKRKIPADITAEQKESIQQMAVKAFKCLGCNGVSRLDFMMDSKSGEIWLNEINTIPGSLSFYLWEPVGVPYSELLDKMISLALKREREGENITYAFDSNVLQGAKIGGGAKGTKGSKV
ncbi:MAG: D-alanine--D-alanine ligase [Faecalibacterium sp.]|nr:D-alanine--D-alanine ligase [Ruminococcus sp.]MCM1393137.1 D-alanine--D-alanine ligase [Ruminococcus sp.]MCM1485480.1 D-alanine--D-alanine ligase [Faecalibacterium sp.]